MLAVPAQIAGCKEIILCTPANKHGKIHPAILYAAKECGITRIFKVGGAQAIAAMAYGTANIPAVYKIFGPGNQYVTAAKQLVQMQGIAIDMPAGPSEVCVLADESADASFVAADLLSQAEHGIDSQVLLVSTSENFVEETLKEVEKQLGELPRRDIATKALQNSKAIVVSNMIDAIDLVNEYAGEHLILACQMADSIAQQITNAGSVFIGNYSPESAAPITPCQRMPLPGHTAV
jgi:histidinol dehydrogenase